MSTSTRQISRPACWKPLGAAPGQQPGLKRGLKLGVRSLLLVASLLCPGVVRAQDAPHYPDKDSTTIEPGQQMENGPRWYDDAVIYQIWVRAFADGIYKDGVGDLPGIQSRLDYLQNLGVNTLWLSPIFECDYKGPNMHGYDTVDYFAVNNEFGSKEDLKNLINAVHGRGMRIIFDFVPNHTSNYNAWFTNATTQKTWYIWKPSIPSGWGQPWGGGESRDVWREMDGNFFYSAFSQTTMPDLNYYNPEVRAAMENVVRYWMDRGFDGMRVDGARYLCETGPRKAADQPDTHKQLQAFRAVLEEYGKGDGHPHPDKDPAKHSAKMMIGEAWTADDTGITPYYGNGSNEFNMCLDFTSPGAIFSTIKDSDATQITDHWEYEQSHYPAGYRTAAFDSNHDNLISRPGTQYRANKPQMILAEALNLLGPGTPILYYGNEVGMTGKRGEDLDLRKPMDWEAVTAQSSEPESLLSWCKYLIKARTSYAALRGGYATLKTDLGTGKALAYVRDAGAERVFVVANLTNAPESVVVKGLTDHGVAKGAPVETILGDPAGNKTLNGAKYSTSKIPPYGVRIYYAAGSAFKGAIHGDLQ